MGEYDCYWNNQRRIKPAVNKKSWGRGSDEAAQDTDKRDNKWEDNKAAQDKWHKWDVGSWDMDKWGDASCKWDATGKWGCYYRSNSSKWHGNSCYDGGNTWDANSWCGNSSYGHSSPWCDPSSYGHSSKWHGNSYYDGGGNTWDANELVEKSIKPTSWSVD